MRIPTFKRIDKQNFDEQYKELIETIAFSYNNDIEVLFQVFNKNVSLKDNVFCTVKDVQVILNSNGIPKNTASFQLDNSNMRVLGCNVLKAINTKNSTTYPTSAPFLNFTQTSGIVTIDHVTGLQADQPYTLTIVAFGS